MSPCPVIMMIGGAVSRSASWCCRSSPLIPGRRTSTTRHAGPSAGGSRKNSCADPNDRTTRPTDLKRRSSAARTEASSSTTNTIGSGPITVCCSRLGPATASWCNDHHTPFFPGPRGPSSGEMVVGLGSSGAHAPGRPVTPSEIEGSVGGGGRKENGESDEVLAVANTDRNLLAARPPAGSRVCTLTCSVQQADPQSHRVERSDPFAVLL